jgi:hypothetical protein
VADRTASKSTLPLKFTAESGTIFVYRFSHQITEVAPTQQSIISATVQRSSSQESLVSDFPTVESVHTDLSIMPQCQVDLEGKIADAGSLMEQNDIVAAEGVSVIPNLEDSILAIQRNGLLGLPTAG